MTGDGVLVARHEPVIGGTTNVASLAQFANRRTTQQIDGVSYADNGFAEDLSLAELKTLRAIQTRGRSTAFDKQFEVPTLAEVIALAKAKSTELGRPISIYPEVKHATYMTGVSLAQGRAASYFEDTLLSTLTRPTATARPRRCSSRASRSATCNTSMARPSSSWCSWSMPTTSTPTARCRWWRPSPSLSNSSQIPAESTSNRT